MWVAWVKHIEYYKVMLQDEVSFDDIAELDSLIFEAQEAFDKASELAPVPALVPTPVPAPVPACTRLYPRLYPHLHPAVPTPVPAPAPSCTHACTRTCTCTRACARACARACTVQPRTVWCSLAPGARAQGILQAQAPHDPARAIGHLQPGPHARILDVRLRGLSSGDEAGCRGIKLQKCFVSYCGLLAYGLRHASWWHLVS